MERRITNVQKVTIIAMLAVTLAAMAPAHAAPPAPAIAPGTSFKIVRPVYLQAIYGNADDKYKGIGPSEGYLYPELFYKTRWVGYQCKIPVGTTITVTGPAPPLRDLWRRHDAYFVTLRPDPSHQLPMRVQLFRGFADASGGLNPEFFEPVSGPDESTPEQSECVLDPAPVCPPKQTTTAAG